MKTIITKLALHLNMPELDVDMFEDIIGDNQDTKEIYKDNTQRLNYPIDINRLMGQLQILKDHGANYVAIDYNSDHIEYELDGLKVSVATQKEIDDFNNEQKYKDINLIKNLIKRSEEDKVRLESRLKNLTGEE